MYFCVFHIDLNNDGCLTYKDFLWAKDKICYMSGWKIDSPKYKITEALFHEIWESLEIIADVDKDGKITKTEWVIKAFYLRCCALTFSNKSTKSTYSRVPNKCGTPINVGNFMIPQIIFKGRQMTRIIFWHIFLACEEPTIRFSRILYLSHSNKHSFCLLCKYLENRKFLQGE